MSYGFLQFSLDMRYELPNFVSISAICYGLISQVSRDVLHSESSMFREFVVLLLGRDITAKVELTWSPMPLSQPIKEPPIKSEGFGSFARAHAFSGPHYYYICDQATSNDVAATCYAFSCSSLSNRCSDSPRTAVNPWLLPQQGGSECTSRICELCCDCGRRLESAYLAHQRTTILSRMSKLRPNWSASSPLSPLFSSG